MAKYQMVELSEKQFREARYDESLDRGIPTYFCVTEDNTILVWPNPEPEENINFLLTAVTK